MRGHAGAVLGLSYASDAKTLASAGDDGIVVLWDSASRDMLTRFDSSCGRAGSIEFAPDGRSVAVGGSDGLAVIDVPHGLPKFRRRTSSPVTTVRFCRGGEALVTSSLDGVIDLMDISHERFHPLRRLSQTPSRVKALAVSPDGMTFVTGADDALLRFYDLSRDHAPPVGTGF